MPRPGRASRKDAPFRKFGGCQAARIPWESGKHANLRSFQRDAFQRRERANEDWAIRQREKERLLELKKKLAEQQQHLQRLSDHMCVPR